MTDAPRSPSVDVIIPVRNGARFIAACLDSVRAQTLQPNAVIVVDDGSTDGTAEVLQDYAGRWSSLRIIRSAPRGVSHARNRGLEISRAPFTAFLDGDDVWYPDKLERQLALFGADHSRPGFVHCACDQIDERGDVLPNSAPSQPKWRGDIFREMIEGFYHIAGSASAVVAHRELIQEAGGFDETLFCGEDLDLWLKLARMSRVDFLPAPLVGLRVHSGNSCNRAVRENPELVLFQRLKIWNKWSGHIADERRVLAEFRREAVSVSMANMLRRRPEFGLYGRLKRSHLPLARRLFGGPWGYVQLGSRIRIAYQRAKFVIATRLIMRNPLLLSICLKLGRMQHLSRTLQQDRGAETPFDEPLRG